MVPGDRLLPLPALEEKVGFKHSKIYALIRAGDFPAGRMIFGKRLWRESEIDAWIEQVWKAAEIDQEEPAPKPETPRPTPPPPAAPQAEEPGVKAYWKASELCERYGVSRSTVYRWIHQREFPAPMVLSGGSMSRWHVDEVLEWEARQRRR